MTLLVGLLVMGITPVGLSAVANASNPVPDCFGHCGGCTYQSDSITNLIASATGTSVTITYHEASPQPASIAFGNTTAKPWSYQTTGNDQSIFLDYLQPSHTYYYTITDDPQEQICQTGAIYWTPGSYSGSFSTTGDTYGHQPDGYQSISGRVMDINGVAPASANNLAVAVTCMDWPYYTWAQSTDFVSTGFDGSSNGSFVASFPPYFNDCPKGVAATVYNYPTEFDGGTGQWVGHWNETMIAYAPQPLNFYLPLNFVSQPIVQAADFSNSNSSNGIPGTDFSYSTGTTYTTETSNCWQAVWVYSGCGHSTSMATGTETIYTATGHNLVVTQQFWTSGTAQFNAFDRDWSATSVDYYQGYAPPVNEPTTYPSLDTITPTNSSAYPLWYWGGGGSEYKGVPIYLRSPDSYNSFTVSSSESSYQVKGFDLSVGVGGYGVSIGTNVFGVTWSQTAWSSSSQTLSFTVYGDSNTVPVCYVVYGVGGSSSQSGTTADAVGVYGYAPTISGGAYTCPLPP